VQIDNHWLLAISGGMLFLAHPIQTQSVNYIVQRMVLITAMFYVGAIVAYWLYRENKGKTARWGWAAVSLISSVLAMHTKEIAITLPVIIVLVEYWFFSLTWRGIMRRWWKLLPWMLTVLIIPAYLLEVRGLFIHDPEVPPYAYNENILDKITLGRINSVSAENQEISRRTYFITEWIVVAKYMRLIAWPMGLNIDHDIPWQVKAMDITALASLALIVVVISFGGWLKWRKRIVGAAGIMMFFIALSVESSIIPIKDNNFEHRLYLPMVGVTLVAVEGLAWVIARVNRQGESARAWRHRIGVAIIIVILVLGGLSYARSGVWANALSLWEDAVAKSPRKARPLNNLGLALEEVGKRGEAERVYRQALESNPENVEVIVNLGVLLGKTRRTSEAALVLERAIQLKPEWVSGYINLGNVYLVALDYEQAEGMYRQALAIKQNNANAWASLSDSLLGQNKNDEAVVCLEEAVKIEPTNAAWFNRLGALYARSGRYDEARVALDNALTIDPDMAVARANLMKLQRDMAIKRKE